MKRSEFIKTLGLASGGLIVPERLIIKQPIKIYDNYIRGLGHYDYQKIKQRIKVGELVSLVRECENIHDSFAIQVYSNDRKLGYIAAFENITLANMMDAGVAFTAFISIHNINAHIQSCLAIEIFTDVVKPTQKMIDQTLIEKRADDVIDLYRHYHD